MRKILLPLLLLTSLNCFSDETGPTTSFEYTSQVSQKIEEVKNLASEDYLKKVNDYREVIEKYIGYKKRVCSGEFSTIILGQKFSDDQKSKLRLTVQERELCFRELKALQINFINNMFIARKRFLDHVHEKRIEDLSKSREHAIESIHSTFAKKTLRKKRSWRGKKN